MRGDEAQPGRPGGKHRGRSIGAGRPPRPRARHRPRKNNAVAMAPGVRRLVVAGGAFLVFYRVLADVEVLHIRRAEREPVPAVALT